MDALDKDEDKSVFDIGMDVIAAYGDGILESDLMTNIKEMLGAGDFSDESTTMNVLNSLFEFPTRYVPAQMKAHAKANDNVKRETYVKDNVPATVLNTIKSGVLPLRQTLPKSYNVYGDEIKLSGDSQWDRTYANYFSAGKTGVDQSKWYSKELQKLYDDTKDPNSFLRTPKRTIQVKDGFGNTMTKILNPQEYSDLSREQGQLQDKLADAYFSDENFKKLKDSQVSADAINSISAFSAALSEEKLFGNTISEGSNNYTLKTIYEKDGVNGVVDYIMSDAIIKDNGLNPTKKIREIYDDMGVNGINDYKKAIDIVRQYKPDADSLTDTQWEIFSSGKDNALKEYMTISKVSTGINKNGDAKYLDYNDKTREIFNRKGEEGLKTYASLYQAATNTPSGSASGKSAFNAVNSKNMTAADKGFYLANIRPNLGKLPQSFADNGNYADVYYYYEVMNELDGTNGGKLDGQLSKAEKTKLIPTLKKFGLSSRQNEVESWYK